jgi:pumilio family protein 6
VHRIIQSDNIRTLDDILAENPQKKPVVLRYLKDNVLAVLNKAEKSSLLSHSILHPVLLGYMKLIDGSERAEFISNISEHLIRVIHSKEGSQVGWQCVSYGSAKDRKAIIKSFKSHVARISLGEFSHFVFMRLLDVTDDTVLITKTFMPVRLL